jgi:hypothetical protein
VGPIVGCGSGDAVPEAGELSGQAASEPSPASDDPAPHKSSDLAATGAVSSPGKDEERVRIREAPDNQNVLRTEEADAPPAKFVEQKSVVEYFGDETIKARRSVNVFSDDRQVSDGKYEEFYPGGQRFIEGSYKDGAPDGQWTYWHANGQVRKTVTFRNGRLDGQWDVLRDDGTKEEHCSFRDGKRDGTWTVSFPGGQQKVEENYAAGQLHGQRTVWHDNGKMAEQLEFRNGKRHGTLTRWDKDGKILQELKFEDDNLVGKTDADAGSQNKALPNAGGASG